MAGIVTQIKLNNYENKFLHRMNEMRKQNILCDVKLIVKDKEFPCHKIMLVNATLDSDYFKTLLTSDFSERDTETISLQDVEPEAMDEILTAIYTTQFQLHRANAYYILKASHLFGLMEIFNTVVSHVNEYPYIDYLIETCLFAQLAEREDLHSKCIIAIAADLYNVSKIDSFNEKITLELFMKILKRKYLFKNGEAVSHIIMQWSYKNKSSQEEIFQLLKTANLKSGCFNMQMMAQLIFIANSHKANNDGIPTPASQNENPSGVFVFGAQNGIPKDVCWNVYLNTVEVKSGAKGWATLQWKQGSNEYEIINYQESNSSRRKVEKIGNKLYCFEYDGSSMKNLFSCFENGKKPSSPLPLPLSLVDNGTEFYDIEAVANLIYLITSQGILSAYNCETNSWKDVPIQYPKQDVPIQYPKQPVPSVQNKSPKIVSCDGKLFIVGVWQMEPFSVNLNLGLSVQYLSKCPHEFTNPAICCYDKKLVICGSDHDDLLHKTVSVYDTKAKTWGNLQKMNIGRANHQLNHHNGYLYAIENKPMVSNEIYDIKMDKWTFIPSLPQRLNFTERNITLATGDVFNCTIE